MNYVIARNQMRLNVVKNIYPLIYPPIVFFPILVDKSKNYG